MNLNVTHRGSHICSHRETLSPKLMEVNYYLNLANLSLFYPISSPAHKQRRGNGRGVAVGFFFFQRVAWTPLQEHPGLGLTDSVSLHVLELFVRKMPVRTSSRQEPRSKLRERWNSSNVSHAFWATLSDIMNLWPPENILPGLWTQDTCGKTCLPSAALTLYGGSFASQTRIWLVEKPTHHN